MIRVPLLAAATAGLLSSSALAQSADTGNPALIEAMRQLRVERSSPAP